MIVAACGLRREARIIARAEMVAVAGGGDGKRLERVLDNRCAAMKPDAVLSIGLAGALAPGLAVGDLVIGVVSTAIPTLEPYPGLRRGGALVEWLHAILPTARIGTVVGQDTPATTPDEKRHLHATTGALAVDMESHIAARVAARHHLPFAAIRVISDDAGRALPPAALVGMRPDGGMALGAVLASLARYPAQLPALIRTGIDAERAFRALGRAHDALGRAGIGGADLRQFRLDM